MDLPIEDMQRMAELIDPVDPPGRQSAAAFWSTNVSVPSARSPLR